MLDLKTRTAVLRLRQEGHGTRTIANALGVSRDAVRRIVASGDAEVPRLERADQLGSRLDVIRGLNESCAGNLVRVHEELWG